MTFLRRATVDYADSPNIDAFSRLRVGTPTTLFSSQCQYDAEPYLYEAGTTGTGMTIAAHDVANRMVRLRAAAGTGTNWLQSYEYIPYQAGKSHLVFITGLLDAGVAGAVVDVGLFDSLNGIFLRQNGTTDLRVVQRSSTGGSISDTAVTQANWNLDKLNGTGPSGITLDVTKVFILVIDAQFLGMGRVRVGFDIDGVIVYVHEFLNANVLTAPYMQSLTLPIQVLITTTASASTKLVQFKCASVSSEGGLSEDLEYQFATPEVTVTAGSGTRTWLGGIRPSALINTLPNRSKLVVRSVDLLVTGNQPVLWELLVGAAVASGPTWTADPSALGVEYATAGIGFSSPGTVIASGYAVAGATVKGAISQQVRSRYPLTLNRAGAVRNGGTLTLAVTGIGGTSACRAMFNGAVIR